MHIGLNQHKGRVEAQPEKQMKNQKHKVGRGMSQELFVGKLSSSCDGSIIIVGMLPAAGHLQPGQSINNLVVHIGSVLHPGLQFLFYGHHGEGMHENHHVFVVGRALGCFVDSKELSWCRSTHS